MNRKFAHRIFGVVVLAIISFTSFAQNDSNRNFVPIDTLVKKAGTAIRNEKKVDSVLKKHSPRKAALRSAILPGWGQAYNKKYWKIPIVYGALGVTGGIFSYNLKWYRRTRYAYRVLITRDSANFSNVYPRLQVFVDRNLANDLQTLRDEFRRSIDYSALFILLFWGLNVVDATVDAHLKTFDVSPDLSFRIKAGYSELAQTNGLSLVLSYK